MNLRVFQGFNYSYIYARVLLSSQIKNPYPLSMVKANYYSYVTITITITYFPPGAIIAMAYG